MEAELEQSSRHPWRRLATLAGPWRTPVLASSDGEAGDARIVVLREVNAPERELVFFTDRRSRKQSQLAARSGVCLLIFDGGAGEQWRLYGDAREIADQARLDDWWQRLGESQRAHYANAAINARENFTAWGVRVERMHCLRLREEGNEAAELAWRDGHWHGHPVLP